MSTFFIVPVTQGVPQTFSISLDGTLYALNFAWCAPAQCWIMNVSDSDGILLIGGVPVLPDQDILDQLKYIGLPGGFRAHSDQHGTHEVPTFGAFGGDDKLYFEQYDAAVSA